MRLYEINEKIRALLEGALDKAIDLETGEVFTAETVDLLREYQDEAVEAAAVIYKECDGENTALKAEMAALKERVAKNERRMESLKKAIDGALDGRKLKTPKVVITFTTRKNLLDLRVGVEALPKEFQRQKLEPDKEALRKALIDGAEVEGASLVEKRYISIK